MVTRKLNMPELPLRGEPETKPVEAKPKKVTVTNPPKPKAAHKPQLVALELPTEEDHAVVMVSFKIPAKLYKDIDHIRSRTKLTATDIFVQSATPQVAQLLDALKQREAQQ